MEIRRDIITQLIDWKNKPKRNPLIIQGARQIGKTWIMKHFGHTQFKYTAYFNFDSSQELCNEFSATKDPKRILRLLSLYTDVPLIPSETLIIFDEIQECNPALNSLKYFQEEAPDYHIIAAGSLLGITLGKDSSFPVGKVEFLKMYPISFKEFLYSDDPKCFDYIDNLTGWEELPQIIIGRLEESYKRYHVCGGMPAAVTAMLDNEGTGKVEMILQNILTSYTLDFSKHAPAKDIPRITSLWNSIPSQLAKENRKFLYRVVKPGARAREYEDSLLWLQQAGLIYRIFCCSKPGIPLSAYDDLSAFKIYLLDSGLLRVMANLPAEIWYEPTDTGYNLYSEFKGALTENGVLQSLVNQFNTLPRYWVSSGTAEVDFILQNKTSVIPAEVKASANTSGKSLSVYHSKYNPDISIIFSRKNLRFKDGIAYIPLYLADWTARLLSYIQE